MNHACYINVQTYVQKCVLLLKLNFFSFIKPRIEPWPPELRAEALTTGLNGLYAVRDNITS